MSKPWTDVRASPPRDRLATTDSARLQRLLPSHSHDASADPPAGEINNNVQPQHGGEWRSALSGAHMAHTCQLDAHIVSSTAGGCAAVIDAKVLLAHNSIAEVLRNTENNQARSERMYSGSRDRTRVNDTTTCRFAALVPSHADAV